MKTKIVEVGNAVLYHGDCFDILPKLEMKFDAVITDPPYAQTNCKWDKAIPLDSFWEMLDHKTKQTANFVMFACGMFTVDLINSKRDWCRYRLVWEKSKKCGHLNANLMPMRSHEDIILLGRPGFKTKTTYDPQKTPGGKVGVITRNHRSSVYRDCGEYIHTSDGFLHPSSVLYFESETGYHSTQKPLRLMEYLVQTYTRKNDIVLDCFMGSGTTGIAALNTGRKFIGIEREKKYFDIACERIRKANEMRR